MRWLHYFALLSLSYKGAKVNCAWPSGASRKFIHHVLQEFVLDLWVFILDRWVFVFDRWVFVLDQWVFVLDQRIFDLDRWVFVLDQWVFVLDQWVFVLDHRVLGLRSSFSTHNLQNKE